MYSSLLQCSYCCKPRRTLKDQLEAEKDIYWRTLRYFRMKNKPNLLILPQTDLKLMLYSHAVKDRKTIQLNGDVFLSNQD